MGIESSWELQFVTILLNLTTKFHELTRIKNSHQEFLQKEHTIIEVLC